MDLRKQCEYETDYVISEEYLSGNNNAWVYIWWLENRLSTIVQQQLCGSADKSASPKLPSLEEVSKHVDVNKYFTSPIGIEMVYDVIKKLGNFA